MKYCYICKVNIKPLEIAQPPARVKYECPFCHAELFYDAKTAREIENGGNA